jgi:transcriptional regulator with PAS, ATPase and Fis domain
MYMRLVSWVGGNDIDAAAATSSKPGAIASTIAAVAFSELHLLYNYPEGKTAAYLAWLGAKTSAPIFARFEQLQSPIDYHDIYIAADRLLAELAAASSEPIAVLISPGTPAMQSVWILLGKTKYRVIFYQSTVEQGVQQVDIPFEIAAEYVPKQDQQLLQLSAGQVNASAAFDDIVTQNPLMETLKRQATVLALRDVPVLIYGETGTGKELFATAIHNASLRKDRAFVPVNCGAIPQELIDSVFFGHEKGAFTGAISKHDGVFKQADGGTLFLDEFGELPLNVQVRLLRVLQSGEVTPVGASKPIKVDVRIIAATNRDLLQEVAAGRFREDLFYRIAVGVLKLPPLRERSGDISLLAETLLSGIYSTLTDTVHKKLSAGAKNLILKQPWRGNIRELQSTLLRASLWATGNKITAADIQQALFSMPDSKSGLLERDVSQGIDIQELMAEIVQHYIPRALAEVKDNKTKAAELLGLKNYQTLNNWIEKYNVN